MEVKERFTFLQSSTECSTAECYTASYIKRPSIRYPSRAAALVQSFHTMNQLLRQRLATIMHKSQVHTIFNYRYALLVTINSTSNAKEPNLKSTLSLSIGMIPTLKKLLS